MSDLLGHVVINKWDDDIRQAITDVGGNTEDCAGLPEYAELIRNQLISNEAVGKGIYQEWLFGDHTTPNTDIWEEATDSTNAPQSAAVAQAIQSLYNTMALTERHMVLLVDEIPKDEINLSAIYLVKSKCECKVHNDAEIIPNTYTGCYFVKEGKKLRKVTIPEFEVDLSKLFYLTREEYDAGLGEYVRAMEDLLRQKFGKYWDDEGFALDEVLDTIVAEIQTDLQNKADEILAEVNRKAEETLNSVNAKVEEVEGELKESFETLSKDLNEEFDSMQSDFESFKTQTNESISSIESNFESFKTQTNESISSIDTRVTEMNEKMQSDFEELSESINERFEASSNELNEKFDTLQSEVNEEIAGVKSDVETFKTQTNESITSIDTRVTEMNEKMQSDFEELSGSINERFETSSNELDEKFETLNIAVDQKIINVEDALNQHKKEADEKYLIKTSIISEEDLNKLS